MEIRSHSNFSADRIEVHGGPSRNAHLDITAPPAHLAPVTLETVELGPAHGKLMLFISTMTQRQPASAAPSEQRIKKLIRNAQQEAANIMPGKRELVAKDILLVRHAVKEAGLPGSQQYRVQKYATSSSKEILETPKGGVTKMLQRLWPSGAGSRIENRSEPMKQGLQQALFAMIDSAADWATPSRSGRGEAIDETFKPQERLAGDVRRIARSATQILDNKQQSEVFARMMSVAHKTCTHGPVTHAVGEWLKKNIQGTDIVLAECVRQIMSGNTALEMEACGLLEKHMGTLNKDQIQALRARFDTIKTAEWKCADDVPGAHVTPAMREASEQTHQKIVRNLEMLFNKHLHRASDAG